MSDEPRNRIWLEVVGVQYETTKGCRVILKGDREEREPSWWPVDPKATSAGETAFDVYKAILNELDKKRIVLARLSCSEGSSLRCDTLRFLSADPGHR